MHYCRWAISLLHHPQKRSLSTQRRVPSTFWTPSFHPGMSFTRRPTQCSGVCCPTSSANAVSGTGQREKTYGCNKCPVQLQQEKMLFSWEICWTRGYSKDTQERQESAPYAGSFISSALVRRQQWLNQGYRTRKHTVFTLLLLFLCLDELIRQETINCPERGLLLFYIRDEIQMNIAAHKALYKSSIAFGMRETLLAEQGKAETEKRVKCLNFLITLISSNKCY